MKHTVYKIRLSGTTQYLTYGQKFSDEFEEQKVYTSKNSAEKVAAKHGEDAIAEAFELRNRKETIANLLPNL